ncbi:hypothetical protein PHLCEN_2v10440 [Hermanssonia centrifuga]|uniref:Macrofage activating glycoprotein n=1 Tax=Hermanssonia centrifuga TaxID=98765 RepID=A0A2R6NMZ1_9APHY|nr:hypothetical protein PHLCEN_2v10440 [Hermanssonia centrifuga]
MSAVALSALLAAAAASVVNAQTQQFPATPLANKHFAYPSGIPYQADTDDLLRGTQQGYNLCNSTTEGQSSLCQTAFVNDASDWCVWAPPNGPSTIGDTEGEEVAWCTKPGRGTRLIPAGAITGVQFVRSPSYLQVIAFMDQTKLNLEASDFGGELDPHGADLRGNPLGGLMYSNQLPQSGTGDNSTFTQVIEWHNFIGSNHTCMKVCDPKDPNAADYCQHVFDRIGVQYTCPNAAQDGVFEMCDSDNQEYPGVYTSDGQTLTYTQPAESLGPITSMPYTAVVPASSNCVTFQSADLFSALPTISGAAAATPTASGSNSGSVAAASKGSTSNVASRSGSSGSASPTGGSTSQTGGAHTLRTSAFATIAGVVFAVAFFA